MRIRLLHPEFFTDEKLAKHSDFARLVFAGLWLIADRDGRLIDSPRIIDGAILPRDEERTCAPALAELAVSGRILRYDSPAGRVIQVVNFKKYQHVHPREKSGHLPGPPSASTVNGSSPGVASGLAAGRVTGKAGDKAGDISGTGPSASASTSTSTSKNGRGGAQSAPPSDAHAGRTSKQPRRVATDARASRGASAPVDRKLIQKHFG